ncbi:DUF982 domain-containing protein [Rhizobium sp. HT1-10]|uniref:DUF982 domain-containing protein n=1 Tax=Rhizobium sp. HT1-10 TaxID=3111638 RepID=UPI003C17DE93
MSDKYFSTPIRVRSIRTSLTISTVWDAIEFLKRWPASKGAEYRTALRHCLDALDGLRSPQTANLSFRRAAETAGLLV